MINICDVHNSNIPEVTRLAVADKVYALDVVWTNVSVNTIVRDACVCMCTCVRFVYTSPESILVDSSRHLPVRTLLSYAEGLICDVLLNIDSSPSSTS